MTSKQNFWPNDKLDRKKDAEFLTTYLKNRFHLSNEIESYGSIVLNINAEWGFGKTYFLLNWRDELVSNGFPVIYFNAWESDFSNDPLLAFISEVDSQLTPFIIRSPKALKHLSSAISNVKSLIRPSLPIIISILTKKLTGLTQEQLKEMLEMEDPSWIPDLLSMENDQDLNVDNSKGKATTIPEDIVSTVASKAVEKALAQHTSVKKSILFFKKSLSKLISQLKTLKSVELPIFIFVDELDRCRPSYAIELLECIKHLFGVKGIYFVIATDSRQLSHSIKAVYGDDFDSVRYLKRFFDQEYSFSSPNNSSFAIYLFQKDKLNVDNRFFLPRKRRLIEGSDFFALCATYFNLSLRDQEQVCSFLNGLRLSYPGQTIHLAYALFLIVLKHRFSELFEKYLRSDEKMRRLIQEEIHNKDVINQRVFIDTINWSGNNGSPGKIYIGEIFSEYIALSFTKAKALASREEPRSDFMREVVSKIWNDQKSFEDVYLYPNGHDLSLYPNMILRVGQLS